MREIECEIQKKLAEMEEREGVRVLYAVESGSRAWGVESPDSDYDVRFIYVRPKEEYLRVREPRDVIEWQLDEVFDINGWDLKKTLAQFHRGNATLFEWANSPVVYRRTGEWEEIYADCKRYFSEKAALSHYYGIANSTFQQYLQGDTVRYKKYVYALRPLLACRYIVENHAVPPVKFVKLLEQTLPGELSDQIGEMLSVKAGSDEKEENPRLPVLQKYIADEIERFGQLARSMADDRLREWDTLDRVFLKTLG